MSYFSNKNGGVDAAAAASKEVSQVSENGRKVQMNRRLFMRTLSMGVAVLALNACGGGGSSGAGGAGPMVESTPGSGSSTEPLWATLPTITFTEGVAGSISVAAYVTDDHAVAITKNAASLPAGVTYDAATKSFVYDGIGAASYTDGHVLTAVEV